MFSEKLFKWIMYIFFRIFIEKQKNSPTKQPTDILHIENICYVIYKNVTFTWVNKSWILNIRDDPQDSIFDQYFWITTRDL